MRTNQPAEAVRLCLSAIQETEEIDEAPRSLKNQIGRIRLILFSLYIHLTTYDKALESALEAHNIYREIGLDSGVARSLNAVGLANIHLGTYANSLENLLRALNYASQLDDQQLKTQVLNNLGLLYLHMEDYPKALEYLSESLALTNQSQVIEVNAELIKNISTAYINLGEYQQALSFSQQCVQQYQADHDKPGEASAINMMGEIYHAMGHEDEALERYQVALKIFESIEYAPGAAQSNFLVGKSAFQQDNLEKAEHHLLQALKQARIGRDEKQRYTTHHLISQVYQKLGNYQEALRHFKAFHEAKETVFNEDIATKIKSLEIIHQVRETQQDREIYRLENVELTQEIEERTRIQSELERLITLDPLTELFNRRHFFELTQKEMDRCQRYNRPLSVIMLDIDKFKRVNDMFGHLAGDRVLVQTAQRIEKALRKVDSACRYGGEEFAVLLPETNLMQAEMVAQRLWRVIGERPAVSAELKIPITISVGVASYKPGGALSVDTLLDQADQAMYLAKKSGRNQVAIYTPDLNNKPHTQ